MKFQENQHFSHNHVLNPLRLDHGDTLHCQACEQSITEPFHGCIKCSYYLHESCLTAPRSLLHPSHPSHPLTLHPSPTYSSRSFTCDACKSAGNGFSLSCARCDFDIHLECAFLPDTVLVENKHNHGLKLLFGSPYADKNTTSMCDVCQAVINPNCWSYYCAACDFGSHLDCVKAKPRPTAAPEAPQKTQNNQYYPAPNAAFFLGAPQQGHPNQYFQGPNANVYPEAPQQAYGSNNQHYYATPPPPTGVQANINAIRAAEEAHEALYAAQLEAQIAARGRQAALDLIDGPPRRYRYDYI